VIVDQSRKLPKRTTGSVRNVRAMSNEPRTCLRCGHEPCSHCRRWCDRTIPRTHILCCDGDCIYTDDPGSEFVSLTDWPSSQPMPERNPDGAFRL